MKPSGRKVFPGPSILKNQKNAPSFFLNRAFQWTATGALSVLMAFPQITNGTPHDKSNSLEVPIPIQHGAKGIKLPYYDGSGKLQMDFSITSAFRVDADHLKMKGVLMQTYDETGKLEMMIDLPSSILDLETRIVKSDEPFILRRSDFEINGDTMQFDTATKSGKIIGKVKMLIYNLSDMTKKGVQ